jgi:cytochrome c oxidase subunit 3
MSHTITAGIPLSVAHREHVLRLGMGMFLGTITMLFGAFSSAYIVRGATSQDWQAIELPGFLWINTIVIVLSSVALMLSTRAARRANALVAQAWLGATLFLAVAFLGGQLAAWQALWAQGIGVPTTPHSSFFFILTGVHGAHLVAGLIVCAVAMMRLQGAQGEPDAMRRAVTTLSLGGMLWHFLAGLWVYLLIMLTLFA